MISTTAVEAVGTLAGHVPQLRPGLVWNRELDDRLHGWDAAGDASGDAQQRDYALSVKAGLHLWNESLDRSHTLSQDVQTASGSMWHGIMHRMEGDYWNAKYWFRQTGRHQVYDSLRRDAAELAAAHLREAAVSRDAEGVRRLAEQSSWDPYLFVDMIEAQSDVSRNAGTETLLTAVQLREITLLLRYCGAQCGGMLDGAAL